MKLRTGWIISIWVVILALSAFVLVTKDSSVSGMWAKSLILFVPSIFAWVSGIMIVRTFSTGNPERKTWVLFTLGASSLVIAEILRAILVFIPNPAEFLSVLPFPFILICFMFLVWGFWYQQGIIETKIGTNIRVLLAIIVIIFVVILVFVIVLDLWSADSGLTEKIFTLLFLVGDFFMFTGALAISIRMWGGRLSLPWLLWSIGTIILVGYHLYFTFISMNGGDPFRFGGGIILAFGLGFLATSAEWRRSLLE